MTMDQAASVTLNCLRAALGFKGMIHKEDDLGTLGAKKQNRIDLLRSFILSDEKIGVPSVEHTLDPVFLRSLDKSWTVIKLVLRIYNNSVAGNRRPAVARAATALERLQQDEEQGS